MSPVAVSSDKSPTQSTCIAARTDCVTAAHRAINVPESHSDAIMRPPT